MVDALIVDIAEVVQESRQAPVAEATVLGQLTVLDLSPPNLELTAFAEGGAR